MRRPSLFTTMWRGAIDVREGIFFSFIPSGFTGDTGATDPIKVTQVRQTLIPYRYIVEDPTSDEAMCGRSSLWLANAVVQWTLNRTDV